MQTTKAKKIHSCILLGRFHVCYHPGSSLLQCHIQAWGGKFWPLTFFNLNKISSCSFQRFGCFSGTQTHRNNFGNYIHTWKWGKIFNWNLIIVIKCLPKIFERQKGFGRSEKNMFSHHCVGQLTVWLWCFGFTVSREITPVKGHLFGNLIVFEAVNQLTCGSSDSGFRWASSLYVFRLFSKLLEAGVKHTRHETHLQQPVLTS